MQPYRLTKSFPYLARRVGVRIGELFDRRIAVYGVTVSMYRALAALVERDGRSLGDLSDVTTIEISTLSRMVGAMIRKGLITRRRPKSNARVVEISLTPAGRALAAELMPIAAHYERIATKGLGAGEVAKVKAALEQAFRNLDELERELDAPEKQDPVRKSRAAIRSTA